MGQNPASLPAARSAARSSGEAAGVAAGAGAGEGAAATSTGVGAGAGAAGTWPLVVVGWVGCSWGSAGGVVGAGLGLGLGVAGEGEGEGRGEGRGESGSGGGLAAGGLGGLGSRPQAMNLRERRSEEGAVESELTPQGRDWPRSRASRQADRLTRPVRCSAARSLLQPCAGHRSGMRTSIWRRLPERDSGST